MKRSWNVSQFLCKKWSFCTFVGLKQHVKLKKVKLRPHAHEVSYATLFIEIGWLKIIQTLKSDWLESTNHTHYNVKLQQKRTAQMYRNRENSSNSPTVPARGTTLSTRRHDNENDTTSRKNDNDQMTAITASWSFLSCGKARHNQNNKRIFHRKSRAQP